MVIQSFSPKTYYSIISSKIIVIPKFNFPAIKKLVTFLVVYLKQYKKKIVLFYIVINLFFSNIVIFNNKEIQNYYVLKFYLKSNFFCLFLSNFVNVYLPILGSEQNFIKKVATNKLNSKKQFIHRISYFNFPVIPESELLCYNNESLSVFINNTRLILDIYIKSL